MGGLACVDPYMIHTLVCIQIHNMMWAQPLQLWKLQFFWEGLTILGIFDDPLEVHFWVISDTDVDDDDDDDEKAWLIHPEGVLTGCGQDSLQASQVLTHQTRSFTSL